MSIRRTPVGRAVLVCVVLLLLASTPALALSARHGQASARRSPRPGLHVTVQPVTGLYPGASRPLTVTFRNDQKFDVLLKSATTSTTGVTGCPASAFSVATFPFQPAPRLRSGRAVTRTLTFGLRSTAGQKCQKRVATVRVTGRVVRP